LTYTILVECSINSFSTAALENGTFKFHEHNRNVLTSKWVVGEKKIKKGGKFIFGQHHIEINIGRSWSFKHRWLQVVPAPQKHLGYIHVCSIIEWSW